MTGHQRRERDVWAVRGGKGGVQRTGDLSWALIFDGARGSLGWGPGGKNVPNKGWGFIRVQ